MIGYFFLAVGCLFVAYCFGLGAGQGIGYKKAHEENHKFYYDIMNFVKMHDNGNMTNVADIANRFIEDSIKLKNEVDTDATVQTSEGSDRDAP